MSVYLVDTSQLIVLHVVFYKYNCIYAARYNIDFVLSADTIYLFDRSPLLEKSHIGWLWFNFILQKVIFTLT